jgi:hypothetical protein
MKMGFLGHWLLTFAGGLLLALGAVIAHLLARR